MNRTHRVDPFELEAPLDDQLVEELLATVHRRMKRALARVRRPEAGVGVVSSPLGRLLIAEGPRGLVSLQFMNMDDAGQALGALRKRFDLVEDTKIAEDVGAEVRHFMDGDPNALNHPVDLSLVESRFQRSALERLREVPPGSVITYQALAAAVGMPSAQRAIGNTVAANPVPIYVPCHRVIRSDGSIGNYGGGVERKVKLLRAEGFAVERDYRVPPQAVFGHRQTRIFCRPQCAAVRRAKPSRMLIFADPEHARRAGLRACRLCRPS